MVCYTWLTKYVCLNFIFKRGVSGRCTWFYVRWKYLVCAYKSHTTGWRRMSEGKISNTKLYMQATKMLVWKACNIYMPFSTGIIWKSFGCCLLALHCAHVSHIHSEPCRIPDGRKNANNCTVTRGAWTTIEDQLYSWWEAMTFHIEFYIADW